MNDLEKAMKDLDDFTPIDTCVVVELEKVKDHSKGGIKLPPEMVEREQESKTEGILIKVGDGAYRELAKGKQFYPKVGNKVLFKRYSGILYYQNGHVYRSMQDIDAYLEIKQTEERKNA